VALFLSTYVNKVDRKGRISVPAPFRSALPDHAFNGIVAYRLFKHDALECCGMGRMEEMARRLESLEQFSQEYDDLQTLFSDAEQLTFDGEGRIVLSDALREFAGITESAAFVGVGPTFQIWEPGALEASKKIKRDRLRHNPVSLPPEPLHAIRGRGE
jgi:MraZ protein